MVDDVTYGKWWVEVRQCLADLSSRQAHAIDVFHPVTCNCGGNVFDVDVDADLGAARTICSRSCGRLRLLIDSEEKWCRARPQRWACPCGCRYANVALGFTLQYQGRSIRLVYLGVRCAACSATSCCADWKIGYEPSLYLMDKW